MCRLPWRRMVRILDSQLPSELSQDTGNQNPKMSGLRCSNLQMTGLRCSNQMTGVRRKTLLLGILYIKKCNISFKTSILLREETDTYQIQLQMVHSRECMSFAKVVICKMGLNGSHFIHTSICKLSSSYQSSDLSMQVWTNIANGGRRHFNTFFSPVCYNK